MIIRPDTQHPATCRSTVTSGALVVLGFTLGLLLAALAATMITYNLLRRTLPLQGLTLRHHRHRIKDGARFVHRLLPLQTGH